MVYSLAAFLLGAEQLWAVFAPGAKISVILTNEKLKTASISSFGPIVKQNIDKPLVSLNS